MAKKVKIDSQEVLNLLGEHVLNEWNEVIDALLALAKKGDIDAARELRLGIIEPLIKAGKVERPQESETVKDALTWLGKAKQSVDQTVQ
jgi:hypothetical protein